MQNISFAAVSWRIFCLREENLIGFTGFWTDSEWVCDCFHIFLPFSWQGQRETCSSFTIVCYWRLSVGEYFHICVFSVYFYYIPERLMRPTRAADEAAKIPVVTQGWWDRGWWEDEEDAGASRLPVVTLKLFVCSLRRDSRRLSRRNKLQ